MPASQTFACPSCGAALVAQSNQTQVTCPYCRATVVAPESVRSRDPQQPIVIVTPPPVINNIQNYQYPPQAPEPVRRQSGYGCCGAFAAIAVVGLVTLLVLPLIFPGFYRGAFAFARRLPALLDNTPQIIDFGANPIAARPGQSITLYWVTNADRVQLGMIASGQTTTRSYSAGTGSASFTLPNNAPDATFQLTAFKGNHQVTDNLHVTVSRR